MYKKTFLLQQHTPLIHFQHDQAGAFLRATEVKPRLDAFLSRKLKNVTNDFKVGFGHNDNNAFNYKLRIRPMGKFKPTGIETKDHKGRDQKFPGFFANMGDKGEQGSDKMFVFTEDPVEVTVTTFHPELAEHIAKYMAEFWATHNFMTRKSKGFGSFSLIEDGKPFYKPRNSYFFELNCGHNNLRQEFEKLFERILLFYRALRSGINEVRGGGRTVIYFKSMMFLYAKHKRHQWDKRKMRYDLFKNDRKFREMTSRRTDPDNPVNYNKGEPYLYRDMLGLASSTKWMSYGNATVEKEAKGVARYPSPLTLKPIHVGDGYYEVYLLNDTDADALGTMADTNFKLSTRGSSTDMKTPPAFDLSDYLNFVASYFDSHKDVYEHVDQQRNQADWRTHTLNDIFEQLAGQHPINSNPK